MLKNTLVTYISPQRIRVETKYEIPASQKYVVFSDGVFVSDSIFNIKVFFNGQRLYSDEFVYKTEVQEYRYKYVKEGKGVLHFLYFENPYRYRVGIDSISFVYELKVPTNTDLKFVEYFGLFMMEIHPKFPVPILVHGKLKLLSEDNAFQPVLRRRMDMLGIKSEIPNQFEFVWETFSHSQENLAFSQFQVLLFQKDWYQYVGEFEKVIDISSIETVNETQNFKIRGDTGQKSIILRYYLPKEIRKPIIKARVQRGGLIYDFYPDQNYYNDKALKLDYRYYFGEDFDKTFQPSENQNDNVVLLDAPIDSISTSSISLSVEYPSRLVLKEVDEFRYNARLFMRYMDLANIDILRIKAPYNYSITSYDKSDKIDMPSKNEITYRNLSSGADRPAYIDVKFERNDIFIFEVILLINYLYVIISLILLFFSYKKIFWVKIIENEIGLNKLILKIYKLGFLMLLQLIPLLNEAEFLNSFYYTKTYLLLSILMIYTIYFYKDKLKRIIYLSNSRS